ncbi:oligoendopeptidase F [Caldicellulosiruptor acetigenus]|uniref:oligoendopeptidase F n=1 Tax=Caldicellulosiruptor acetigenus TaxID=301953 RepID=UPI000406B8C3|nr:oligoendopeptidase F [Caldicellulosiruptor acetigenus]WAM37329.1 oligoendopeptidase F [Caldicellulosiruptor acetigenus]
MKRVHLRKLLVFAVIFSFIVTTVIGFASEGVKKRSEIPDKYKWNLEDIYSSPEKWNEDLNKVLNYYIPKFQNYKGKLSDKNKLLECLKLRDEMMRIADKVYVYAHMKADENQADNKANEMRSKSETMYAQVSAAVSFIQPELLRLPEKTLKSYMQDKSFADYKMYLDAVLKQKPHTLSPEGEELLALAQDFAGSPYNIFTQLKYADLTFPKIKDDKGNEIQLTEASYGKYLESKDRDFRKRAFEGIYSSFDKVKNTLAATLTAEVKKNVFFAKARKYNSALEASLAQEFIPRSVYDNLIKAVNNNIKYLHKYVELRKKVLNLDKVHIYDMYVPLVANYEMNIDYEQAKNLILEGLKPLGNDYLKVLNIAFNNRWIDVFETENKYTGGYQWGAYDTHPYILMNYNNTMDSVLTLAHELGHAINSYYTNKTQKYINSNVPIFTAEVASTTNELLMINYLLKKAKSDDERLYLLNTLVENIRGTVYTQVMYAEFEKEIHERVEKGEALSAETLSDIWGSLMKKYYGDNFEVDKLATLWWARIPHFYMNFYVYKYATSMAAANEVVKNIEKGDTAKYIEFLKAGSSDYPINVLKKAGVDMTSTKPVDNLLTYFGQLVDEMEKILKKQGKI